MECGTQEESSEEATGVDRSPVPVVPASYQIPHAATASSISCLKERNNSLRALCLQVVSNPWFDRITMLVIFLNCIFMAMYKPCEDDARCHSFRCKVLEILDYMVFAYFISEMILKMIAFGVFGQNSYFSDRWNWLDCFIVVSGVAQFMIELVQFSTSEIDLTAIRTIRVLRPLRAVHRVESLRIVSTILIDTVPRMLNVLVLFLLFFFIFGYTAVQLWAGSLRNRCIVEDQFLADYMQTEAGLHQYYVDPVRSEYLCTLENHNGMHTCDYKAPSFERDTACNKSLVSYYNGTVVYPNMTDGSCINWNQYYDTCAVTSDNPFYGIVSFDHIGKAFVTIFLVLTMEGWADIMYYMQDAESFWCWIYFIILIVAGSFFMVNLILVMFSSHFAEVRTGSQQEPTDKRQQKLKISDSIIMAALRKGIAVNAFFDKLESTNQEDMSIYKVTAEFLLGLPKKAKEIWCKRRKMHPREKPVRELNGRMTRGTQTRRVDYCAPVRTKCRTLVESHYFRLFVMAAILLNTITLAMEHHNQPPTMTEILTYCNIGFTVFFALEMALKLFGLGIHDYFIDPFNLFDAIVVVLSVIDVFFQDGDNSGLSVLRTFRLFRILKLVRFLPGLRHQVACMAGILDEVAVFFFLIFLLIFVFSLMGMQLFGRKFCLTSTGQLCGCGLTPVNDSSSCTCSRTNFDTFANASLTVFQILTTENWNEAMFDGMHTVGHWTFIYFLLLMTIGNYILLNLLVAILVDGVSKQRIKEQQIKDIEKLKGNILRKLETLKSVGNQQQSDMQIACQMQIASCANAKPRQHLADAVQHRNDIQIIASDNQLPSRSKLHSIPQFKATGQHEVDQHSFELVTELVSFYAVKANSCICMVFDPGPEPGSAEATLLNLSNYLFTVLFVIEISMKVIAYGLIIGKNAFLKCRWNILDGILALLTLFVISSFDAWVNLMYQSIDAVAIDIEPVVNYNPWAIVYYVVFIIIMCFLVMNLFICVVVENYQKAYEGLKAEKRLRKQKQKRLKQQIYLRRKETEKSFGIFRSRINAFIHGKRFLNILLLVLVANAITLCAVHYQMPLIMVTILDYFNWVFTGIYAFEALLKIIVFHPRSYIKQRQHLIEIFLISTSLVGILMDQFIAKSQASQGLQELRTALRIVQGVLLSIRLATTATVLKSLVDTIFHTLPQVGNLMILFFMLFFIFAVLGVEMFGTIGCDPRHPCDGLGEYADFANFGRAFLTLFRITTGDNWSGILQDVLRKNCDDSPDCKSQCCVNKILGTVYFFVFVITAQYILLNIVVAMLLKGFEETAENQEDQNENMDIEKRVSVVSTIEDCLEVDLDTDIVDVHF